MNMDITYVFSTGKTKLQTISNRQKGFDLFCEAEIFLQYSFATNYFPNTFYVLQKFFFCLSWKMLKPGKQENLIVY